MAEAQKDRFVKFTRDYDHAPAGHKFSTKAIAYKRGMELSVPASHAEAAIEAGAAEEAKAPKSSDKE